MKPLSAQVAALSLVGLTACSQSESGYAMVTVDGRQYPVTTNKVTDPLSGVVEEESAYVMVNGRGYACRNYLDCQEVVRRVLAQQSGQQTPTRPTTTTPTTTTTTPTTTTPGTTSSTYDGSD